ncbi:unnamed protein product [Owenia fusiformis]|uniref:Uncharacterized protein n=1 Tax=Owenia fusiformis TaxID=6347 RepID=A0A8J1U9V2_OWEFU|nr:unnamed protein product [Owenia fusiformis]
MTKKCARCGKPVYFAEAKTSLGKDWHRQCLRCEECGKVLNPGQHAEHKGSPYCHLPCYSALFGPTLLRQGQNAIAHSSFGNMKERSPESTLERSEINRRIQIYNRDMNKNGQLKCKEVNGRMVFDGLLRVHWGLKSVIHLQDKDNIPVSKAEKRASILGDGESNGFDLSGDALKQLLMGNKSPEPITRTIDDTLVVMRHSRNKPRRYNTMACRADRTKRYSINGHLYNQETSVFVPPQGTVTCVRVSNSMTTMEVIQLLFDRFKVQNDPKNFVMSVCQKSGETKVLKDNDHPLVERIVLGPVEDEAKIFLLDRAAANDIPNEVASYVGLPEPVLNGFLEKIEKEESQELNQIKQRYELYRKKIGERIKNLQKGR